MNIPTYPPTDPKARTRDTVIKTLAGIGLAVILVAAGWVGVKAAQEAPSALSAVGAALGNLSFGGADDAISVTVEPTIATSTEAVVISWQHTGEKTDGSYTLSYECRDGLHLEHVRDENTETIFCNTAFNFVNLGDALTVRPVSATQARTETNVRIDFTPNGETRATDSGSAPLIVLNPDIQEVRTDDENATTTPLGPEQPGNVAGTSVTPTPTVNPTVGTRSVQAFNLGTTTVPVGVSDPNGTPDLAITILDTGEANASGAFTHKDVVDTGDLVAVQFEVRNLGTKSTGPWRFRAELPTRPRDTFRSPVQDSLLPGERMEYVMSFTRVRHDSEVTVTIELDDNDVVDESNENNNRTSVDIEVDA